MKTPRTAPHWLLILVALILGLSPMIACSDYDQSGLTPAQACAADPTCHGRP
jgi:hypothetical protein